MEIATLISVVIVLVVLGVAVYLIETILGPTLAPPFRILIRVVIVLGFLFWLLRLAGGWRL